MSISGYQETSFAFSVARGTLVKPVFRKGEGPGVIIMHEMTGLAKEVIAFADSIVDAGFTVFVPCLFGTAGDEFRSVLNFVESGRACVRREIYLLAKNKSSPITQWLRGLSRFVFDELGGRGVGAIGMCLTGNFVLSLSLDKHMMAPVMSQPSLPLSVTKKHREALHIEDEALAKIKGRCAGENLSILGLRFREDLLCPKERFARMREEFGDAFEGIEIDSASGNRHGIGRFSHSVLTYDLVDKEGHPTQEARNRVIEFLQEKLV